MQTASEWQVVFLITAAVYLIGAVLYGLLASGEKQDWADGDNTVLLNGKEAEYGATNGDPRSPVAAAGGEGKDIPRYGHWTEDDIEIRQDDILTP